MKEIEREYILSEAAKIIGVHKDTIIYWEENGLIPKPRRNPNNNYRIYNKEEIKNIIELRSLGV